MKKENLSAWLLLILLGAGLMSACGGEKTSDQPATPTTEFLPTEITYCDIAPSEICLISFGFEIGTNLLVTFAIDDPAYQEMSLFVKHEDSLLEFTCEQVENIIDRMYCRGENIELGESIDMTVFANSGEVLARGSFVIDFGERLPPTKTATPAILPTSLSGTPTPTATVKTTSTPATPSYPSYP